MNISPIQLIILSIAGLLISLAIHLLTVLNIYLVSNTIIMILTAGVLIVWLQSSRNLKQLYKSNSGLHPWKAAFKLCPVWAKYLTYFIIIYAIFNFALSMSFKSEGGYIDLTVSQSKLRGLSGFWMAFYTIGLAFGYAVRRHQSSTEKTVDQTE